MIHAKSDESYDEFLEVKLRSFADRLVDEENWVEIPHSAEIPRWKQEAPCNAVFGIWHPSGRQFANSQLVAKGIMPDISAMSHARPVIRETWLVCNVDEVRHKAENLSSVQCNPLLKNKRADYRKYDSVLEIISLVQNSGFRLRKTSNNKFSSKHSRHCFVNWKSTSAEW